MSKLLLVQPHSDDVLFSSASLLLKGNKFDEIVLFTVENNPKRIKEDENLLNVLGIDKLITSENLNFEDKSYYHYYKEMGYKDFDTKNCGECLDDYFGLDLVSKIYDEVRNTCKKYKKKGFEIITCLGVGHPTHYLVRKSLEDIADLFYRDFPHSYKRKGLKNIDQFLGNMKLHKEIQLTERENDLKWEIAKKVYKTQSSVLFFEQGYIKKNITEKFYTKI